MGPPGGKKLLGMIPTVNMITAGQGSRVEHFVLHLTVIGSIPKDRPRQPSFAQVGGKARPQPLRLVAPFLETWIGKEIPWAISPGAETPDSKEEKEGRQNYRDKATHPHTTPKFFKRERYYSIDASREQ